MLLEALRAPIRCSQVAALLGRIPKLVGTGPAAFAADEQALLPFPVSGWTMDLLARVALLVHLAESLDVDAFATEMSSLYRHGETRERVAVLRALPLFPEPARFERLASRASASRTLPVFEAIACENPYPADHFSSSTFRHMVLEAVFVELPLTRIMGLERRVDAELAHMAAVYAGERAARGGRVSSDALWLSERARA